jgi:hypothetical protein
MGITIPSNPKLKAGNILCASGLGLLALILIGNRYFPESISSWLNYCGIVVLGLLCVGVSLRNDGKQEQRADFNLALQQKLQQEANPGFGTNFAGLTPAAPAQVQNPQFFQAASQITNENQNLQPFTFDETTSKEFVTCPACGKGNNADNAFCNHCGARIR